MTEHSNIGPLHKRNNAIKGLLDALDIPTYSLIAAQSRLQAILDDHESLFDLMQAIDVAKNTIK